MSDQTPNTAASAEREAVGRRAFEWMRDGNNALPGSKKDARSWEGLSANDRDRWIDDANRRPHLYGMSRAAPPVEAGGVEPVAWRWRCKDPASEWFLREWQPTNDLIVGRPHAWEIQPLYTRPTPTPAGLVEAVQKIMPSGVTSACSSHLPDDKVLAVYANLGELRAIQAALTAAQGQGGVK